MTVRTAAALVPCRLPGPAAAPAGVPHDEKDVDPLSARSFAGLKLPSLGSALTSGRIGEVAARADDSTISYGAEERRRTRSVR